MLRRGWQHYLHPKGFELKKFAETKGSPVRQRKVEDFGKSKVDLAQTALAKLQYP